MGVVKALEENGIKIMAVSGTSAGSIVAFMIAAGLDSKTMINIAKRTKFYSAFKMTLSKIGLISMENLSEVFKKDISINDFKDVKIPLFVCATNLSTGNAEYINSGDIQKSVVASCSIPGIFHPFKINNVLYGDGGLADNLPVKPLKEFNYKIMGVNVIGDGSGKEPDSYAQLIDRTIDIVAWQNTRLSLEECDYQITMLETAKYGIFDFKKVDELVEIGYRATNKILQKELQAN